MAAFPVEGEMLLGRQFERHRAQTLGHGYFRGWRFHDIFWHYPERPPSCPALKSAHGKEITDQKRPERSPRRSRAEKTARGWRQGIQKPRLLLREEIGRAHV